jgi:arylsulfatase A-like enzyme
VAKAKKLKGKQIKSLNALERARKQTLKSADAMFVSIWQTLQAEDRLDNTYIFVISDNGLMMGEHRLLSKGVVYDQSVRIPMIVWSSEGDFERGLGDKDMRLVGNIDIAPTIAEVVGLGDKNFDGKSLLSPEPRQAILLESLGLKGVGFQAIRTEQHLYVVYLNGYRELYDKNVDPFELTNIIDQGVPSELPDWLNQLKTCAGDNCTIPPPPP